MTGAEFISGNFDMVPSMSAEVSSKCYHLSPLNIPSHLPAKDDWFRAHDYLRGTGIHGSNLSDDLTFHLIFSNLQ